MTHWAQHQQQLQQHLESSPPRSTSALRTATGHRSPTTKTPITPTTIVPSSVPIEPTSAPPPLELLDLRECQHLLNNNKKESHPRLKFTEGAKLGVAPIFSTSSTTVGTSAPGTAIVNDSVNLASSTNNNRAKVLSSKQLNMNLISGGSGPLSPTGPPTPHPVALTLPLIASATFKHSNLHRNHQSAIANNAPACGDNGSSNHNNNTNHLINLNNNHIHSNNNNAKAHRLISH
uniref:Uncharacterized protein n=1 Tax=Anopheles melas TaxID=34690 RepID=A0A182TIB2_9DIPT